MDTKDKYLEQKRLLLYIYMSSTLVNDMGVTFKLEILYCVVFLPRPPIFVYMSG